VQYRSHVERLAEEYVGPITERALGAGADVTAERLRNAAEVLSETVRMIRAIPHSRRAAMWSAIAPELQTATKHCATVGSALNGTGIAAALDADDHIVMSHIQREMVPEVDLNVLRLSGETDPEAALQRLLAATRAAPRSELSKRSVEKLLDEVSRLLENSAYFENPTSLPKPLAPKRWSGWGKVLTGFAVAGANIASGFALSVGFGPLAGGATLPGVISSCGVGVGAIAEGIGHLRGE
jgi:hypothetical protein